MGRPVTFKRLFLHSIFNASFLCWLSCTSLITWVWVQLVGCRAWLFTLNLSTPFAGHCSAGGLIWRFIFASRSGALRSCYHYHSHSGLADDSPVRWRFAESVPVEPTAAETEVTVSWLISGADFMFVEALSSSYLYIYTHNYLLCFK